MKQLQQRLGKCFFIFFAVFIPAFPVCAQNTDKVVFKDDYALRNNMFSKKLLTGAVVQDAASGEKLLIVSGIKNLSFYWFEGNWKLKKKFEHSFVKKSGLSKDGFKIMASQKNGSIWGIVVQQYGDFTTETIDVNAETLTLQEKILQDMDNNFMETVIRKGNKTSVMYISKDNRNAFTLVSFDEAMKPQTAVFNINTQLPLGSSKKFSARDLYAGMDQIDTLLTGSLAFTRKKMHLYDLPQAYAFSIVQDEPVAELNYYDKKTGALIKSDLFSVETLLPETEKKAKLNTSFLFYDGKAWVFSAYKNGGVLGVFDAESKKMLYHFKYTDNNNSSPFNYPPVMFEVSPGTVSTYSGKGKEKTEDISMDKFCKEMFQHSLGIAIRKFKDNSYAVILGNHDNKQLLDPAAASPMRTGSSSFSSSLYYISTSAGLLFKNGTLEQTTTKTTRTEVYNHTTNEKLDDDFTFTSTGTYGGNRYTLFEQLLRGRIIKVYYEEGELFITERSL